MPLPSSNRLLFTICLATAALAPVAVDPLAAAPVGPIKAFVPLLGALLAGLVLAWRGRLPRLVGTAPGKALIACLGVAFATSFTAITIEFAVDELIRLTALVILACAAAELNWTPRRLKLLFIALLAGALINGWLALAEHYVWNWWPWKFGRQDRLVALFGHQNTLAQFLIQPLLLGTAFFAAGRRSLWILTLLGIQAVLAISLVRGAWLGGLAGWLWLWWRSPRIELSRRRLEGLALASLAVTTLVSFVWVPGDNPKAPFLYKRNVTTLTQDSNRVNIYQQSLSALIRRPLLGAGPGNFPVAYQEVDRLRADHRRYAHNDFLHWGVETGLLGLTTLFFLIWTTVANSHRAPPGVAAALLATAVHSLVSYNFYMPVSSTVAALLFGILVSCLAPAAPTSKHRFSSLLVGSILAALLWPRLSGDIQLSRQERLAYDSISGPEPGLLPAALKMLQLGLVHRPHDVPTLMRIAQWQIQLATQPPGQTAFLEGARQTLESLQGFVPYSDHVHLLLAHVHALRRDMPAYVACLEKALDLSVHVQPILEDLWLHYRRQGLRDKAAAIEEKLRQIVDWPTHRSLLEQRLAGAFSSGPLVLQELELERQIARVGAEPELLAQLASINYQLGRVLAAKEHYRRALQQIDQGEPITDRALADLLMGAGNVHLHLREQNTGFELFRRGRALFPADVRFVNPVFLQVLHDKGWPEALKILDEAIQGAPDPAPFRYQGAVALGQHAKGNKIELLEGLALLNTQVLDRGSARDYFERARFHDLYLGQVEAARRDYRLALDHGIDPEMATICQKKLVELNN